MDALAEELIRQLALEGSKGCELRRLWTLLEAEFPMSGLTKLDTKSKPLIWNAFVGRHHQDFGVYLPEPVALSIGLVEAVEEKEVEGRVQIRLPSDRDEMWDLSFLQDSTPTLIASEPCRHQVLGICDAMTSRFKISEKQLETLEEIGKSRKTGCLQSDLARSVGVEHKNFFFIMKQLEGRELAVRNPIILNNRETELHQHSVTNIIHLPMFAPDIKLQQFQTFKMVDESENEEEDEDVDSGVYRMRDDAFWMRQVVEKISPVPEKTVLEFDLKQSFGFRGSKGHRLWRRLKKKMVDLRLVEIFIAQVLGKPSHCVKLLEEDFDGWLKRQREGNKELALEGPESCLFAEKTLNHQLLEMIIEAGPQGINSKELFTGLRLNSKRNSCRLKQLQQLYGIEIHTESYGKTCVNRCFAPLSILKNLPDEEVGSGVRPTVSAPPGGWMMAVQRAIMVGLDLSQESNLNQQTIRPQLGQEEEESDGPSSALPSYPDPTDEAQKRIRKYLFSNLVSTRSDFRYKQLLEKIREEEFMLRGNVGAFFKEQELAQGEVSNDGKGPDRKTVDRVIKRLIQDKKVKKIKVSMLPKTGGDPKKLEVLIRNDLIITEALLQRIRQANRVFATACRQRSNLKTQSQLQESKAGPLPVIDNMPRLPPSQRPPPKEPFQGLTSRQICRNGYIHAKMIRVKLLHNLICRLVGLAGCQPSIVQDPPVKDQGFPKFVDPRFIEKTESRPAHLESPSISKSYRFAKSSRLSAEKEGSSDDMEVVYPEKDPSKYSFTPRQLWDSLPTDLYLQIVGSNHNCAELISKIGENLTMEQIPVETQVLLVDKGSRNRLAELLDVLCRMQLVETAIIASNQGSGLMESAKFITYTTGTLEEPVVEVDGNGSIVEVSKKVVKFSFGSMEELESYWMQLEFVFSAQKHLSASCFPATIVPEVCAAVNWSSVRLMSMAKWLELTQIMDKEEDIDWRKCKEIANRMNISYQQVLSFSYQRRRKQKIKKSALEGMKMEEQSVSQSPVVQKSNLRSGLSSKKRKRRRRKGGEGSDMEDPSQVKEEVDEMEEDGSSDGSELKVSGYWCKEEDTQLLSAYVAWRTTARPTRGRIITWRAMQGLPGGFSLANIGRCKRRLRYLQKQDNLSSLFDTLESTGDQIYIRRLNRIERSTIRDLGSSLVDEYCPGARPSFSASVPSVQSFDSEALDLSKDQLRWEIPANKEQEILGFLFEVCDPDDTHLFRQLRNFLLEIVEKAPRMIKRESENAKIPRSGKRQRELENSMDWSSTVVSIEKKRKTLGFRLGKDRLTLQHHEVSLPIAFARDFIISCLVTSQNNKFLTEDMAKELVTRFKDAEMLQALSCLHQEGWVNPGGTKYPINLSPAFKTRLTNTGLESKFFKEAAKTALNLASEWSGDLMEVDSKVGVTQGKVYKEVDVSTGCLASLLSAVVKEEADLSVHSAEEGSSELSMDFKVLCRNVGKNCRSSVQKKEGLRTTFSELLKETEMETEASLPETEEAAAAASETNAEGLILLDVVDSAGDEGLSIEELKKNWRIQSVADVDRQVERLMFSGDLYSLDGPKGQVYMSSDHGQRFVFENCEKEKSKMVQIKPWRYHTGELNTKFLETIQLQVLNAVMEHPGIQDDLLVEQIDYCSAHNAKKIIAAMLKEKLLKQQKISVVKKKTVIPDVFQTVAEETEVVERTVYFPNLEFCFDVEVPVVESFR